MTTLAEEIQAAGAGTEPNGPVPLAAKKTRPHPPSSETKRDKFERVVGIRVGNALHAIQIIGTVGGGNRFSYDYGQSDVEKIIDALDGEVTQLRDKLSRKPKQMKMPFTFGKDS